MNTLFGNLDEIAIERIREFAQMAEKMNPSGYYVAFSGGKDSTVILDLVKRAGVKFTAHYHLTTCDPPELVHHVRENHPEVIVDKPAMTMWQLIRKRKMPPRRNARYCCEVLKEGGGSGQIIITGVRWGESSRRSKRSMVESCYKDKSKRYLHCIIEWSETDVWNYIKSRNLSYCKLYDEGFGRIGCVLCPMTRDVERQIERWPKLAAAWEKAVKATWKGPEPIPVYEPYEMNEELEEYEHELDLDLINPDPELDKQLEAYHKMISDRKQVGVRYRFPTAEAYWQWWLDRDAVTPKITNQMLMFEDQ